MRRGPVSSSLIWGAVALRARRSCVLVAVRYVILWLWFGRGLCECADRWSIRLCTHFVWLVFGCWLRWRVCITSVFVVCASGSAGGVARQQRVVAVARARHCITMGDATLTPRVSLSSSLGVM